LESPFLRRRNRFFFFHAFSPPEKPLFIFCTFLHRRKQRLSFCLMYGLTYLSIIHF
jgi:hypothetical protein